MIKRRLILPIEIIVSEYLDPISYQTLISFDPQQYSLEKYEKHIATILEHKQKQDLTDINLEIDGLVSELNKAFQISNYNKLFENLASLVNKKISVYEHYLEMIFDILKKLDIAELLLISGRSIKELYIKFLKIPTYFEKEIRSDLKIDLIAIISTHRSVTLSKDQELIYQDNKFILPLTPLWDLIHNILLLNLGDHTMLYCWENYRGIIKI